MSVDGVTPIFITGVYRSGTTLLSRMLDAHSKLSVTYDSVHFMRFNYRQFDPITERYAEVIEDVIARCEARWGRSIDLAGLEERMSGIVELDYGTLYHTLMETLLLGDGMDIWGEKTLMAWSKIPAFLDMFPGGKTILVIRDPRDVMASNQKLTYEPGLRYMDAAFACLSSMRTAMAYESAIPASSYITVRYEDLVGSPRETAERMCSMIGLKYEPAMVDPSGFMDYAGQPWQKNTSHGGVSQEISSESVGKYEKCLTPTEVYFTEMICRYVMERFQYTFAAKHLSRDEWLHLYSIMEDDFIGERYTSWLKSNDGVEAYPSAPPRVLRDGPLE